MNIDRSLISIPVRTPYVVEELLARKGATGGLEEIHEQVVLTGSQLNRSSSVGGLASAAVNLDRTVDQRIGCVLLSPSGPGAAQDGFRPCGHLPWGERFRHVVISTHFQSEDPIELGIACRHHHDRSIGMGHAKLSTHFKSVHAWQTRIDQTQ